VTSLDDARAAAGELSYPVLLKWSEPNAATVKLKGFGLEAKKYVYARTPQELIDCLAPYAAFGEFPLIQEYCAGIGVGHTFLAKDGEVLVEFQHERLHECPPEGGTSSLCRAVPLSDQSAARAKSRALLKALRWTGVAMVEYRHDRDADVFWFMEVNGRFWGSLPLPVAAGVPFPTALVAVCGQGRTMPAYDANYPPLTCRYLIPETKWLLRILFQRSRIQDPSFNTPRWRALLSYVVEFFRPSTRYYVLSFSDPKPFFVDAWNVTVKIFERLRAMTVSAAGRGP
jgi:predicted ATP-grasp superfamily ATP-dependent carboligase